MRTIPIGVIAILLIGCSSGLQERSFMDQGRHVVSRSLVNERVTANQPHSAGTFICLNKISSIDMADLRRDGQEHSWFYNCEPAKDYVMTSDQPVGTIYKGPIEAAILGGSIGAGLALSGDTVTQQGGGASASAKAKSRSSVQSKRR